MDSLQYLGKKMISVKNLFKSFDDNQILSNVSIDIPEGKITTILGESGCGKSVLLKHLAGFYIPDSGEIYLDKQRIDQLSSKQWQKLRRRFTMVFQNAALFDWLSVYDNIALPLKEQGQSTDYITKEVDVVLKLVGLAHDKQKRPTELSIGMQKRVSIARALVLHPEYILYDEPTAGLDPLIAQKIIDIFSHIQKELHPTTLIVTHDLNVVRQLADYIAILHNKTITVKGSPETVFQSPDPYVRAFFHKGLV